jgi:uncharacterized membrane protein YqjE
LTRSVLALQRLGRQEARRMRDLLMIGLTVLFFAAAFALVAWLERV